MQPSTKETFEDIKQIPRELRNRVQEGTEKVLERLRSPLGLEPDESPPLHVVPRAGGWAVLPRGSDTATDVFDTKDEAVSNAKKTARDQGTMLVIHRKDGTIQRIQTYQSE